MHHDAYLAVLFFVHLLANRFSALFLRLTKSRRHKGLRFPPQLCKMSVRFWSFKSFNCKITVTLRAVDQYFFVHLLANRLSALFLRLTKSRRHKGLHFPPQLCKISVRFWSFKSCNCKIRLEKKLKRR